MIYLVNLISEKEAVNNLRKYKEVLTRQQYRTILGQIKHGDRDEAMKGLNRLIKKIKWQGGACNGKT